MNKQRTPHRSSTENQSDKPRHQISSTITWWIRILLGLGVVMMIIGLASLFGGPIASLPPIKATLPFVQLDVSASTAFGLIVLGAAIAVIPVTVLVIYGGVEVIEMIGMVNHETIGRRFSLRKGWRFFLDVLGARPVNG